MNHPARQPTAARLHYLRVATYQHGEIRISWSARQALMQRCKAAHEVTQIRATFAAVGTSRPVVLKPGQRAELLTILDAWFSDDAGGEPVPEELLELRNALADEA